MSNSPVQDTTFQDIYRLSKRHAQRFGWSNTNADVCLVAKGRSTLGDLNPSQWRELQLKWELDLDGVGSPPPTATPSFDEMQKVVLRHKERFGRERTRQLLFCFSGGQPLAAVPFNRRKALMKAFELDIEQDRQRARRVAGKPDAVTTVTRTDVLNPDVKVKLVINDTNFSTARYNERTRRLRRGPIEAAGVGILRQGARVVLADGRGGRVAACEGTQYQCSRLVVVMDDTSTRVISGVVTGDQVKVVYHLGGRFATGGFVKNVDSLMSVVDAARRTL